MAFDVDYQCPVNISPFTILFLDFFNKTTFSQIMQFFVPEKQQLPLSNLQ